MIQSTISAGPDQGPLTAARARPFAPVPHDLASDPKLTPTDVRVVACLLRHARARALCWPGDGRIAEAIGKSVPTVQRALRRLEAAGWIRRETTTVGRRARRVIVLAWRTGATPSPAGADEHRDCSLVISGHCSPVSREWKRNREGEALKSGGAEPPNDNDPEKTREAPEEAPGGRMAQSEPIRTQPPGSARPPFPETTHAAKRGLWAVSAEQRAAWSGSGDPILEAEAMRKLEARARAEAPKPPAPATTAELLARVRECPTFPASAAKLLAEEFGDAKSWNGFMAKLTTSPPEALVIAYREASGAAAKNPGAVFMHALKRESGR